MKILMRQRDLSNDYILFAQQIGADGFDIHNAESVPGLVEQDYSDLEQLVKLKEWSTPPGLIFTALHPPNHRSFLWANRVARKN